MLGKLLQAYLTYQYSEEQRLGIRNFLIDLLIKYVSDDKTFASEGHLISKLNYIIVLVLIILILLESSYHLHCLIFLQKAGRKILHCSV